MLRFLMPTQLTRFLQVLQTGDGVAEISKQILREYKLLSAEQNITSEDDSGERHRQRPYVAMKMADRTSTVAVKPILPGVDAPSSQRENAHPPMADKKPDMGTRLAAGGFP